MVTVEQCAKLTVSAIPYRGKTRLVLNGRGFGVTATPKAIGVVSGNLAQRIERVKLPYGGNAPGGFVLWFRCPTCGRKAPTLYLPPGSAGFACRHCLSLRYEYWRQNGLVRQPKTARAWLEWFMRRAGEVRRHHVEKMGGRGTGSEA